MRLVYRRHAVCLVHNDEVPVHLPQPGQYSGPLRQIKRCDDSATFEPLVDPELVTNVMAFHDQEFCVELFFEFALPLKGEVGWANNENALSQAAQLQFADQKA